MLNEQILTLINNKVFLSLFFAWFTSHLIKFIISIIKNKKIDFLIFFKTGGMPSSHSASVTALSSGVYFAEGITNLFVATIALAALVIYDAQGIRHESSKHARLLNLFIIDKKLNIPKLKELLGHEASEVFVGSALGIFIAFIIFFYV